MLDIYILSVFLFINLGLFLLKISVSITTSGIFSLIICIYSIIIVLRHQNKRVTFSTVVLLYTIATQFGLVIPYIIFGRGVVQNYSSYTLRFLEGPNIIYAMYIANIAILSYTIANRIVPIVEIKSSSMLLTKSYDGMKAMFKLKIISTALLSIVLCFFLFHFFTGGTSIVSTYEVFRASSAYNSSLYSYILILFYVGTLYLASSGKIKDNKISWGMWILIVLIFSLNGNKGEFMYALLSVVGLYGVKGNKINIKMILLIFLILFVLIPFITSFRDVGILTNINNIDINFTDAFAEMGMQIRTSVYVLDDIGSGIQEFLFGKSYYLPFINIMLFFISGKNVATSQISLRLGGMGFSQVSESYLNLGILGVIVFFFFVSYFLTILENKENNNYQLAYLGSITCVLINATRNYFAFVPGQILIVTVIYLVIKKFKIKI